MRIEPWIQTNTGMAVDILDPRPEQLNLRDIAFALSYTNRFCGHIGAQSVAIHSMMVGDYLAATHGHAVGAWGYFHDASEAYLGDVSAPLKAALPAYRAIEERMQRTICAKFLGAPEPTAEVAALVKEADMRSLASERRFHMAPPRPWGAYVDSFEPLPQEYAERYGDFDPEPMFHVFRGSLALAARRAS